MSLSTRSPRNLKRRRHIGKGHSTADQAYERTKEWDIDRRKRRRAIAERIVRRRKEWEEIRTGKIGIFGI